MKHTIIAIAFVALAVTPVRADEAADHMARGTRHYNIQEWTSALKEYKEAYAIDPRPEILWAIAQTQRLSGDCRAAILSYKAYVRGASANGASAATEWIKSCEADLEAQRRAAESAAAPATPASTRPAAVEPAARVPAPRSPPRSWVFDPLGDILFVTALGGMTAGAIYTARAMRALNGAPNKPTAGDYARAVSDGRGDRKIGIVLGAAGTLCLGAAIWRFARAASSAEPRSLASAIGVAPAQGGATVSYTGSF